MYRHLDNPADAHQPITGHLIIELAPLPDQTHTKTSKGGIYIVQKTKPGSCIRHSLFMDVDQCVLRV